MRELICSLQQFGSKMGGAAGNGSHFQTGEIEGIRSADFLSEEQKRDIFFTNAARFLRWNGSKEQ